MLYVWFLDFYALTLKNLFPRLFEYDSQQRFMLSAWNPDLYHLVITCKIYAQKTFVAVFKNGGLWTSHQGFSQEKQAIAPII